MTVSEVVVSDLFINCPTESMDLQREDMRRAFWYEYKQWVDHLIYVTLPSDFRLSEKPPSVSVED